MREGQQNGFPVPGELPGQFSRNARAVLQECFTAANPNFVVAVSCVSEAASGVFEDYIHKVEYMVDTVPPVDCAHPATVPIHDDDDDVYYYIC